MTHYKLHWVLGSLALFILSLVAGCGGGSSTSTSSSAGTGSVAVMLTDAPADPDLFSAINASIERVELIGQDGGDSVRVSLYRWTD